MRMRVCKPRQWKDPKALVKMHIEPNDCKNLFLSTTHNLFRFCNLLESMIYECQLQFSSHCLMNKN